MKCSVAVHCLIFIYEARGIAKVTSGLLAESTGCNPVVIRNIMSALKKAGLITVPRGTGGAELCADPDQITLYQIYTALEPHGLASLIGIHPCQERACPVAQNIRKVLQSPYHQIEDAVRQAMEGVTLRSMIDEFESIVHPPEEKEDC
ncbi:Rrf2 family transcriptional regulator [Pseudoflavonifractor sp. CLA-AP-H29]|uniref:Rrf2 family transcriptional regulator n=1 Tax=Pseudoflavonifractor intestinihominis TaxID=3133171 RepID=A0ABV1E6B0_9FIRM